MFTSWFFPTPKMASAASAASTPLRAAALSLDTDDGAARIAAAMLAQRLAALLGGG